MALTIFPNIIPWLEARSFLIAPLLFALWIAGGDIKSKRIPNYLTLAAALSGLACRGVCQGFSGLLDGFLGLFLGFALLVLPYGLGGMGAGDVKALAALGAWLGPKSTFWLFLYMGVAGGVLALGLLCWRGLLWQKLRQAGVLVVNWILSQRFPASSPATSPAGADEPGIPYGVALATGMLIVFWVGN